MADNKYNQSLLDMGYSQEQIDSMVNAVRSWQNATDVVRGVNEGQPPRAENVNMSTYKGTDANGNVTTWPWNANLNYNQYWDDSNPNQQSQKGWLNDKYTGEWTSNTYIAYNPNLRTSDLDPNYLYGQAAKDRNRQEAGYIARRNDNIASALYNEWRVSKEDVAQFLASQNEWMNSTEADRLNTIESVWKRLWQIKPQEEEPQKEYDPSIIENALDENTSGRLYGKVTADEWGSTTGIDTLADANSVYKAMNEGRIANVKALISMKPSDVATSMYSWINPYGEQAWRDVQQYYPEFAADVEAQMKKLKGQENVNAIASGWSITTSADTTNTDVSNTAYAVSNSTTSVSATQLLQSIDSILASNDSAKSAEELMWLIEKDMAKLKNRLMNLKNEARSAFKWDVPQYIVTAYMNNKSQEIQNQLSILEDRYNAAYDRYKTEMANAQWQSEFELKKDSLALEKYKANYGWGSGGTNGNYMRTERNNNPTAMTTDVAKSLWLVLGVDYEVWDPFTTASGQTLYTARLLWDPIETTIKALDNWARNPNTHAFYTARWGKRWTHTAMSDEAWLALSNEQKREIVYQMLQREWGKMENMAYYLWTSGWNQSYDWFDLTYKSAYEKYLSWEYTNSWLESQAKAMWITTTQFDKQARAYANAKKQSSTGDLQNKAATWTRKDGTVFNLSDTPTFDTLTYDQRNIVYQLLNLNKNPNTITKRQYGDDFEKILSAVLEINPNWSEADYWQADKVKKEWNTSSKNGSNSRNWTAIATAMDIYNMADEIGNVNWKDWNWMMNKLKDKLSAEDYTRLSVNLEVLASEYAWALKGNNAAPTEQEIESKKQLIAKNLWSWAMKTAAIEIAKTLYNKNANEADNYIAATFEKPPLVVTQEVADWMYNVVGIKSLPERYKYTPSNTTSSSSTNKGWNAPKITSSWNNYWGYSSIDDAIRINKLKQWTREMLKKKWVIK